MPQVTTSAKQNVIEPLEPKAAMLEMVQVVENKKRNLEKRKQKLEALQAKPAAELTEQQQEAVSHIGEVNGNIQYVDEILIRFREIQQQVDKWSAIEAKKEKLAQRSKRNAKKNGENAPPPGSESVANEAPNASADATPRSRGSMCETASAEASAANPAKTTTESVSSNACVVQPTATGIESARATTGSHAAAVPEADEGAPVDDEIATPKDTLTFVNSQVAVDASTEVQVDGEQAQSGADGRPFHPGPRGNYRPYYNGPRGGGGYGYGRAPRRGRGGGYRGGRGGAPRGAAPNANAPLGSANSQTNEFRGG